MQRPDPVSKKHSVRSSPKTKSRRTIMHVIKAHASREKIGTRTVTYPSILPNHYTTMPRPRSDTNPNSSPSRRQQHHPSVRALDAETVEEIAAAAVSRGGSDDLVRDQLLHATVRRSHNPVPVVANGGEGGHAAHVQQSGAVPIASARE